MTLRKALCFPAHSKPPRQGSDANKHLADLAPRPSLSRSPPLDVQPSYPAGAELAGLGSSCATPPWLLMPLAEAGQAATAGQPDKMVAAVNVTADSVFAMQLRAPKRAATRLGKLVCTDRVLHPRESGRRSPSSNDLHDLFHQAQGQVLSLRLMASCLQSVKVGTEGESLSASMIRSPWPRRHFLLVSCSGRAARLRLGVFAHLHVGW